MQSSAQRRGVQKLQSFACRAVHARAELSCASSRALQASRRGSAPSFEVQSTAPLHHYRTAKLPSCAPRPVGVSRPVGEATLPTTAARGPGACRLLRSGNLFSFVPCNTMGARLSLPQPASRFCNLRHRGESVHMRADGGPQLEAGHRTAQSGSGMVGGTVGVRWEDFNTQMHTLVRSFWRDGLAWFMMLLGPLGVGLLVVQAVSRDPSCSNTGSGGCGSDNPPSTCPACPEVNMTIHVPFIFAAVAGYFGLTVLLKSLNEGIDHKIVQLCQQFSDAQVTLAYHALYTRAFASPRAQSNTATSSFTPRRRPARQRARQ